METRKELVLKTYPHAYAAFLVPDRDSDVRGWIIRHGASGNFRPITARRRKTEDEAWEDAALDLR